MEVLVFSNVCSGLYSFRKELLRHMVEQGHTVNVAAPKDDYTDKIKALGCEYTEVSFARRGMNPSKDLGLLRSYIQIIKSVRPDIVLTYTVKPNVYGGLACQLTHTPYLANVTGLGTSIENGGLLSKIVLSLYKAGLKKANCVFFQNPVNRAAFEKLGVTRGKTRLIPGSGVNLEQHCFEPYPDQNSPVRFLFAGRIMRDKGINELLEAAEAIKKEFPQVQFDLIGSFDEDFRDTIDRAAAQGIVNYWGRQSDVHSYYKQSWAVIMPSYHEGMSNVCLESAATGRPVLATDVPGCRETYDDGVSGFGFPPKNAQALTDVIRKFLALPDEAKAAMGRAGREKVEREFDRNLVIQAYMEEIHIATSDRNE